MAEKKLEGHHLADKLDVVGSLLIDGTAITSTAAELNILDGVTATKDEINVLDGIVSASSTATAAAENANAVAVAIQFKDANGADLAVRASVFAYLSDDANGDSVVGTAPDGGVAIGTDGVLISLVSGKAFQLISEADGDIDLVVTESGTKTCYLVLVLPNGKLVVSNAITHAA